MNVYVFRKFNKKISPMDKKNMLFRAFSHYKKTGNIDENCDLITLKIFKKIFAITTLLIDYFYFFNHILSNSIDRFNINKINITILIEK